MRFSALMAIRLGPSLAYTLAATLLVSMALLHQHPASPWAWALYMTVLPAMREPVFLLLALPGMDGAVAVSLLALAALAGIYLAARPERHPRTRFIHAHLALIAAGLGLVRAANAQAGLAGLSLPQLLRGDWALLPTIDSALWVALFVLVSAACLASHIAIIRRIRKGDML